MRVAGLAWLIALAGLALLVYGPGESFWPVTLFLFGPRWVLLLPLVALLPAAAASDRRLLVALTLATAFAADPLFGFNVPWRRLVAGGDSPRVRVATWNVDEGVVPLGAVAAFIDVELPDVVALQECPESHVAAPPGWYHDGQHGMAVLSRFPVLEVKERDPSDMRQLSGSGAIVRYAIETPAGRIDLTNVHLETPREGLESILRFGPGAAAELQAKNAQREIEARVARRWVDESPSALRLVAGDFNAPVESDLFREFWRGLRDCHSDAGWGFGFTKRTRRIGTRIDHVLAGPGLECVSAHVGPWRGGDHAPLIVDVRARP